MSDDLLAACGIESLRKGSDRDLMDEMGFGYVAPNPLDAPDLVRITTGERTPRAVLAYITSVENAIVRDRVETIKMDRFASGPDAPQSHRIVRVSPPVTGRPADVLAFIGAELDRLDEEEDRGRRNRERIARERIAAPKGGSGTGIDDLGMGPYAERHGVDKIWTHRAVVESEYMNLIRLHHARKTVKTRGQMQSNTLWVKRSLRRLIGLGETVEQITQRLQIAG